MEVWEWIAKYWVNWVCALIAGGIVLFAKHYIKIQKQALEAKWQEKEKNMCGKIICTFEDKINEVKENSEKKENKIYKELGNLSTNMENSDTIIFNDLKNIHKEVDTIESGILSIQGK